MKSTPLNESNIANFGTELEFKIKLAASQGEPAFNIIASTEFTPETELKCSWRVRNFKLEEPTNTLDFFRGDSYLLLNINRGVMAIFYWIGNESTIDEAGTAAYKAFELDNILTSKIGLISHYREVCDCESELFRTMYSGMRILSGGYDSGFHVVRTESHRRRLLRVYVDRTVEVPCDISSLRNNGAFILDDCADIYQWIGEKSPISLKAPTMAAARALDDARTGACVQVVDNLVDLIAGLAASRNLALPEEVSGTRSIPFTSVRNLETGLLPIATKSCRVVAWANGKFVESSPTVASNTLIFDYGSHCLVKSSEKNAALCMLVYFDWAKTNPVPTTFLHI